MTAILAILSLLRTNWKLALVLAAVAVSFGLGWWERGLLEAREEAATLSRLATARKKQEDEQAKASALTEAQLAALQQANRELTGRTAHETTKPAYRCALPADGVQLRSAAIAAAPAE